MNATVELNVYHFNIRIIYTVCTIELNDNNKIVILLLVQKKTQSKKEESMIRKKGIESEHEKFLVCWRQTRLSNKTCKWWEREQKIYNLHHYIRSVGVKAPTGKDKTLGKAQRTLWPVWVYWSETIYISLEIITCLIHSTFHSGSLALSNAFFCCVILSQNYFFYPFCFFLFRE